jgi:hypothetical protein
VRAPAPPHRRARSDAPYQPDKMRISGSQERAPTLIWFLSQLLSPTRSWLPYGGQAVTQLGQGLAPTQGI